MGEQWKEQVGHWLGRLGRLHLRAAQVRLVVLPVAGLALVAAMAGMGVLPQDPLISFVILLQASCTQPHPSPSTSCSLFIALNPPRLDHTDSESVLSCSLSAFVPLS